MDPRVGTTVDGRYVVGRRIGKGGMGAVYEGEHLGLDRKVAIKFLAHHGLSPPERERFRREARLASRVVHENVSQVYDIGAHEGDDFIVMEFVEGLDLRRVIEQEGPLEVSRATQITRDLLEGLHAIHAEGIVHRDVKPANVMLTRKAGRECVKIVDFGIARAIDERTLTVAGYVVGTAEFMAPEQVRGAAIDHRADLYAVGIVLFSMLTTELPFNGPTAAVGAMQVFEAPPSLESKRAGLPPLLIAAVERAMAKLPADRFADARQFSAALERITAAHVRPDAVTTSSAPTVVERLPQPTPRPRRSGPWLALGATILVGVAIGIVVTRGKRTKATAPVVSAAVFADAGVVPDAAVADAASVVAAAHDAAVVATHDAAVIVRPPPAQGSARAAPAVAQRCRCIPRDGRENIGLCPSQGTPLCRCDAAPGNSLCATPPVACDGQVPDATAAAAGRKPDGICKYPHWQRCPDLSWDRYLHPGKHGDRCTGYDLKGDPDAARVAGTLVCNSCEKANTLAYRGVEGAPCTGYWWRTGESLEGTLQQCRD